MATWKRDAASGLVVLLPILVTVWVVTWLYRGIANVPFLQDVVQPELFGGNAAAAELARVVLTLLVFGALVFSIGYLMRTALGAILEGAIDDFMNQVPGLRIIYNASKMAVETTLSGASELQTPVKVEPWEGMRLTAFKTGKRTEDGREVVFMPTAPNITTGFVIEVEPEDLKEIDESVEDALTRILSAGFGESRTDGIPIDVLQSTDDAGEESVEITDDG
ncbi:MAG: DUF502 domain-containing protein [Halobacteriales archaeon]|nr:DUF502 domain-containing protein [Halobacteriales archaeon]